MAREHKAQDAVALPVHPGTDISTCRMLFAGPDGGARPDPGATCDAVSLELDASYPLMALSALRHTCVPATLAAAYMLVINRPTPLDANMACGASGPLDVGADADGAGNGKIYTEEAACLAMRGADSATNLPTSLLRNEPSRAACSWLDAHRNWMGKTSPFGLAGPQPNRARLARWHRCAIARHCIHARVPYLSSNGPSGVLLDSTCSGAPLVEGSCRL